MRNTARFFVATCLLVLPGAAGAADVPVSYLVDAAALKLAVTGTNLTFTLYSDSSCTATAASSVAAIDDLVAIGVKRFKPSGGDKPPKTAEIRTTIAGVTATGHFYLKVTGTGVTPIGGACQAQAATGDIPATCNDTIQNQGETDVDCGGPNCSPCAIGQSCLSGTDCQSSACSGGLCVASCSDGIQNQGETGIDCGGPNCGPCGEGGGCATDMDCQTSPVLTTCVAGTCVNHCLDNVQNGDEPDINCGGMECPGCDLGQMCSHSPDCLSNNCVSGTCNP